MLILLHYLFLIIYYCRYNVADKKTTVQDVITQGNSVWRAIHLVEQVNFTLSLCYISLFLFLIALSKIIAFQTIMIEIVLVLRTIAKRLPLLFANAFKIVKD